MELKPGYKQTEVGVIPNDWETRPLAALCRRVYRGASPRPIDDPRWFDDESTIGWVRIIDVTRSRRFLRDTSQRLSAEGVRRSRFIPRGSLIMSICATVGRPIETALDACIHDGFVVYERPFINQSYLYHILCDLEPRWSQKGQTGSQMNLNTTLIKQTLVPIPPKEREQQRIAKSLDDIDAFLNSLDRLIVKKRNLKQAAMQQLLTGHTRLPGFEGKWRTKRLGDHLTFLRNGTNSRAELTPDGLVRYLHYGDVHAATDARLDPASLPCLPQTKAGRLDRLRDGDLVIADASEDLTGVSKSVEICNVGATEVVSGQHTIAVRFDKSVLADGYKGYLQHRPPFTFHLRRLAAGTKVYATNRAHVASVKMPLPEIDEQIAIATVLHEMDAELKALAQRRAKTASLKQAMMQDLLTGRVRLIGTEARSC